LNYGRISVSLQNKLELKNSIEISKNITLDSSSGVIGGFIVVSLGSRPPFPAFKPDQPANV